MAKPALDTTGVILECPSCGQKNRLAFERLGAAARCGRCKAPVGPPADPIDVPSIAAFDALTRSSALPVVVDFWAEWCGPCRMVAPEMTKVAASHAGRIAVVKVDTEALPELAARHEVRSIPMLAVFADGRLVAAEAGARPAAQIVRMVSDAVARR